jgi:hypothetical protein
LEPVQWPSVPQAIHNLLSVIQAAEENDEDPDFGDGPPMRRRMGERSVTHRSIAGPKQALGNAAA